jgi:Flp pilus assembly protein TadG
MHAENKGRRRERGAVAVEMALVLPMLFLLMFGILEFGRFFWMQHSVTAAATEGARMAILDPGIVSDAEVNAWTEQVAADGGVTTGVTVTVTPANRPRSAAITVTVSTPYQPLILPQLVSGLVMPSNITESSTMVGEP